MKRQKITEGFKQDAVEKVIASNRPASQIARELGVSDSALSRWVKEFRELGWHSKAHPNSQGELARLRQEVSRLRTERNALKKAVAVLAQE